MEKIKIKKVISSAILYTDRQQFLAVHPTMFNYWDIPKGEIEKGETPEETIVREFKEETGVTIDKNKLSYVGTFTLHLFKDIVLYTYVVDKLPNISAFKCKSMTKAYGKPVPELDDFKYLPLFQFYKMRQGLHRPITRAIAKLNRTYIDNM